MLDDEIVITKIVVALLMHTKQGMQPVHKNRPSHGLVFNIGCTSLYTFDSGKTFICNSGECIYLPKGSNYVAKTNDIDSSKESGVYAINFLTLSEQKDAEPFVRPIKSKDEMQSLFYKAAMAWQKKNAGYYEECFSDLYRIIKQIKKEALDYSPRTKSLERIMPALEYIDDNYLTENISVGRLASLCDTSEVYLRKKFREVFSESPAVYMRNKRIKYAKELLQSMEYSVTEVAMLSGFNDTSYFIREFKKAVGTSPSDYRK